MLRQQFKKEYLKALFWASFPLFVWSYSCFADSVCLHPHLSTRQLCQCTDLDYFITNSVTTKCNIPISLGPIVVCSNCAALHVSTNDDSSADILMLMCIVLLSWRRRCSSRDLISDTQRHRFSCSQAIATRPAAYENHTNIPYFPGNTPCIAFSSDCWQSIIKFPILIPSLSHRHFKNSIASAIDDASLCCMTNSVMTEYPHIRAYNKEK